MLTGFFFVDAWLLAIALQRMAFGCLRVGIRARAALTTMIARKCYGMAHLTKETVSSECKGCCAAADAAAGGLLLGGPAGRPQSPCSAPKPAGRHHPQPTSFAAAAQCLQAAEAVGFVANDINKIFEGIQEVHYLW